MLDFEKSFEEIDGIYAGFPLKEDYMELGNAALAPFGVKAVLEDGVVRIPFADRPLFDEDEIYDLADDDEMEEELRTWTISIAACISLEDDPADGIRETCYEYEITTPDNIEGLEEENDIRAKEYDKAIELIEAFLNVAVDAG